MVTAHLEKVLARAHESVFLNEARDVFFGAKTDIRNRDLKSEP